MIILSKLSNQCEMYREYLSKSINSNDLIDKDADLYCGWKK